MLALTRRTSQQRARQQHAAKAQLTFAPPLWKLSPSCALDVSDRRAYMASLSTCTTNFIPPAIFCETGTAPRVLWVAASARVDQSMSQSRSQWFSRALTAVLVAVILVNCQLSRCYSPGLCKSQPNGTGLAR